jgi:hypothetical protein
MGVIAFLVLFTNALFPALLPRFATEVHTSPLQLKWLIPEVYASEVYASDGSGRACVVQVVLFGAVHSYSDLFRFAYEACRTGPTRSPQG